MFDPELLISLYFNGNGAFKQAHMDRLSKWIQESPENAKRFVHAAFLHRAIHDSFVSEDLQRSNLLIQKQDVTDLELWKLLAEEEKNAPAIEIPEEPSPRELIQKVVYPPREKRKISKFNIFVLINAAAVILFFLYLSITPPKPYGVEVATITSSMDAKWADVEDSMLSGTRLHIGRTSLFLKKGLVELVFDNHAKVTIEGPAEFQILAEDRFGLNYGKVFTMVPEEATGFSVYTQSAKIIDLGTEFGVNVDGRGETNVHLYKGKASLVPVSPSPQQTSSSQILYQGQARRVNSAGKVDTIKFNQDEFVRSFNSESKILWSGENLNLAYVASGSNGFEPGAPNMGIDQATGKLVSGNTENIINEKVIPGYIPVPQLPYVDGIFVPDGGEGPVQLTSAGHVFDDFGDTEGNYFFPIGSYSHVYMKHADLTDAQYTNIHLADYPEGTAVNLCLHANSGITFDLQKIRQSMPFVKITGFSSIYGVPVTREDLGDVHVDFYVFVDGVARMVKKNVYNHDKPKQVNISLTESDRFLTLVCTEGALNMGDWSMYVNPELELESVEK